MGDIPAPVDGQHLPAVSMLWEFLFSELAGQHIKDYIQISHYVIFLQLFIP